MKAEITSFLKDRRSIKQSKNTIVAYEIDLRQFAEYSESRNIFDVANIDNRLVADYIGSISHLAASTIQRKASAISEFCAWLYKYQKISKPIADIDKPKIPVRLRKFLSIDEQQAILVAVSTHIPRHGSQDTTIRDTAMLRLFIDTGLRFSELLELKMLDLTLKGEKDSYITIIGKGNKQRKLYISRSYPYIMKWLEYRESLPYSDSEYIFLSERSCRKISDTAFRNTFSHWLDKAGLQGRGITPHTLRHTAATNYYVETKDIRMVQHILGHTNPNTTAVYAHIVDDNVAAVMA